MDLKNINNKSHLLQAISSLCSEYTSDLTSLANNPSTYKRAALLYYWLRDYRHYLKNEHTFSPNFYPSFERGNIVNVNLGFNLGSEMGGLHYGIVITPSNRKNPNLIILPMTSIKPTRNEMQLRPTEVYIGQELFHMIQGKYSALHISITTEIKTIKRLLDDAVIEGDSLKKLDRRVQKLNKQADLLRKTHQKLQVLKKGSIVEVNQIRTVSKMRLVDPTNEYDILYGLKISPPYLNAIDKKIFEVLTR